MALLKIDQASLGESALPAGVAGRARNDGTSDGAEVTLTDMTPGGVTLFEILWVDPNDVSSSDSLHPTVDPHVWQFTPTEGITGPIRIRLTHTTPQGVITQQTRIFGIPDANGVVTPAPGERSDPNANLLNASDPAVIARCERNWPTDDFPLGNPFGWGTDLLALIAAGSGGGAVAMGSVFVAQEEQTVETGINYVCADTTEITLPDATLVPGQQLSLTFAASLNVVKVSQNYVDYPNYFVTSQGYSNSSDDLLLPAGTYEFHAFYDPAVYPIAYWIMKRLAGTSGRRSVDVDRCMTGALPEDYSSVAIGESGDRVRLIASETGTTRLESEAGQGFVAGETVLIPFDSLTAGLFRVVRDESATDWELELLEPVPDEQSQLDELSETEYRIRTGYLLGGRRFMSHVVGAPSLSEPYPLQRAPLEIYPTDALINGTGSSYGIFTFDRLLLGKMNRVTLEGGGGLMALQLVTPPNFMRFVGERFAIKICAGISPRTFHVIVPEGQTIESTDHTSDTENHMAVFTGELGMYAEWTIGPDGVWMLVSYIPGLTEGG